MLYVLVRILEDVGHGNIINSCYYSGNRSSGSGGNMIGISNEIVVYNNPITNPIGFWFSFWYMIADI